MGTARGVLIAAVSIVALVFAGCGGGSGDETSTISTAAFIKKADAICQRGNERMAKGIVTYLKKQGIERPRRSDYEALVGKVFVPSISREVEEFRELGTPSEDGDVVDAMIQALEEGAEVAERDPKAVTSSSDTVFGIASRLAKEYGLEVCGSR
jgi:hypothetical protein